MRRSSLDTWTVDPFVVEAARAAGVDEIGFTEHIYYFTQTSLLWDGAVPDGALRVRHRSVRGCGRRGAGRGLPVKLGLEVDYVPGREDETRALLAPYPWDYLLGSVHFIDGLGVDGEEPRLARRAGRRGRMAAVLRDAGARLRAAACFDSLSHPDLVKIFGERAASFDYGPVVAAIADSGVAVEVSTAGLHKPVGELYPHPEFLAACRARDVPVTLASGCAFAGRRRARLRPGARAAAFRGLRDRHGVRAAPRAPGAARMSLRVGIGVDAHAFADGVPLVLGGVTLRVAARARRATPTVT